MKYIIIILLLALTTYVFSEYQAAERDLYQNKIEYTKFICDQAHAEIAGASEEDCGRMQDETNTKYTCNATKCYLKML